MPKKRQLVPPVLPWSLHKGRGWRSQLERMDRWYARMLHAKAKTDIADFLFAFFQNSYHFREWLEATGGVTKKELDLLFKDHPELGICRDICNATKHFSLSTPPPPNQQYEISFVQEHCPQNGPLSGDGWFGGEAKLTVVADKRNYDARDLAYQCLEIWKAFVAQRKPEDKNAF
ncbi:hypothetical protein [Acidihalobacter prosperus]|uniref:hypothetical protein n=1 Tax=Acidihalobacter prosperus TaxID=160660 RepID=UPI0011AB5A42|nr:hypothetical protein [Acidihalobacter prosperus]